jgi:hypothetical protein
MHLPEISGILGSKNVLRGNIASRMDLIELSSKGVTKDALLRLASSLSMSISEMAKLLPVTERTIQRYKRKQRFNRVVSNKFCRSQRSRSGGQGIRRSESSFLDETPVRPLGNALAPPAP